MEYGRTEALDPYRRPPRRAFLTFLLLTALLLGAGLAATPRPASAVAPVAAEPQSRQKLSQPPGAVTLAFSREVDPSVAKVIVSGPGGDNVTSGTLIVEGTNVTSRLRSGLARGTYTVHYRIDRRDGEPEGGAYQFSYGDGSFTDLPDKSWSGEDDEPAVLRGSNPNGSGDPETPSATTQTPGIEVTSQAPTTAPPPTEKPSTVKAPEGPTTDAGSGAASSVTATPDAGSGSNGSGTPWIIGGVLLLAAVAGTGIGIYRNRTKGSAGHE